MDKKSILAIEKIITCIIELKIMTKGRDDNYFYNGYEMPILCNLVDEITNNLNKINPKIKCKYNNINWNIMDSKKDKKNKLGVIWDLASKTLEYELLDKLNKILEIELPIYYTKYCNYNHNKAIKERDKNNEK